MYIACKEGVETKAGVGVMTFKLDSFTANGIRAVIDC